MIKGQAILKAEPKPIEIDFFKTALLVVDMQNAFVRRGGYLDLLGFDISVTEKIITPCRKIVNAARKKGVKIIYLQMACSADLLDIGNPNSPVSHKSRGLAFIEKHPEMKDRIYIHGTWGANIIEELKQQPGDIIIRKQKYDGFVGTDLHTVLKSNNIKYLIFIGTATNICVETTLRHAFSLNYFPILVSDAVSQLGPAITQEATIHNVRSTFGWVTTSQELLSMMKNIDDN